MNCGSLAWVSGPEQVCGHPHGANQNQAAPDRVKKVQDHFCVTLTKGVQHQRDMRKNPTNPKKGQFTKYPACNLPKYQSHKC